MSMSKSEEQTEHIVKISTWTNKEQRENLHDEYPATCRTFGPAAADMTIGDTFR